MRARVYGGQWATQYESESESGLSIIITSVGLYDKSKTPKFEKKKEFIIV